MVHLAATKFASPTKLSLCAKSPSKAKGRAPPGRDIAINVAQRLHMKLIIGLGNPGKEYEKTRHNAGFMALDQLMKNQEIALKNEPKFKAEIGNSSVEGQKIIVAKPQTYMNNSGEAVAAITQFYKIAPEDIFVIYDDLDLPLGQIRLRAEGGPGTHNGMKSIVQHLGSNKFPRIRIGIESRGATSPKEQDTSSFVLTPFNSEEKKAAIEGIKKAEKALIVALSDSLETAMNLYNGEKSD